MKASYFYFLLFLLFGFVSLKSQAQDDSPIQLGADLMSRYVWRGMALGGSSPSIQPWAKYSLKCDKSNSELTIGTWGAYTFSQTSNQEVDLYITYTYREMFSITVTDYFFPELFPAGERAEYFNFDKDSTCHLFEGTLMFNGTEKIPFSFLFGMNFYGNDARRINSDGSTGDIFMSKYAEIGYKKNIKGVDFNLFVGAALDKPDKDKGETGFYGNEQAGIINLGVKVAKSIPISESYALPVQASFITNPEAGNVFLVFGFSF